MLQSVEPLMLLSTVPLEVCIAGGGVLCTAIAAQWRAANKTQESSIAAITKSDINSERSVSLLEAVVAEQARVAHTIDGLPDKLLAIDKRLDSIDKRLAKFPAGDGGHRATGS